MVNSTDIPDWIFACTSSEEMDFTALTPERKAKFFSRSPTAYVQNVTTPAQLLIGDKDLRVPPHAAYFYHAALK